MSGWGEEFIAHLKKQVRQLEIDLNGTNSVKESSRVLELENQLARAKELQRGAEAQAEHFLSQLNHRAYDRQYVYDCAWNDALDAVEKVGSFANSSDLGVISLADLRKLRR